VPRLQNGFATRLIVAAAFALLAGCGRAELSGPVRTPGDADEIARRALKSAHLDEEIVSTERYDGAWLVTTRRRESSAAGHLITIDAASGAPSFERYRTLEIGQPPRPQARVHPGKW